MTRTAISPRLAMRTFSNTCPSGCSGDRSPYPTAVPAPARTSERGPWRVEWFTTLDSTNRYALDAARDGAADRLVVVADVQTAGRGRLGRAWEAPPGSSLLVSVLLRRSGAPGRAVMAAGVALATAVEQVAGVVAG